MPDGGAVRAKASELKRLQRNQTRAALNQAVPEIPDVAKIIEAMQKEIDRLKKNIDYLMGRTDTLWKWKMEKEREHEADCQER